MTTELFRIAVARRLRMPLLEEPACCPRCGMAMDKFMDHALVRMCGGDRTSRHNAVRDALHTEASSASLRSEREKAGLLPPRPEGEESTQGDVGGTQARRPADVWLPRGPDGRPTAVDFAVTSGLKPDMVVHSAQDGSVSIVEYEARKREYLDTEKQCRDAGMTFAPFVLEAHGGGVGPTGRRVCGFIASAAAATTGTEVEVSAAQRICSGA